MPETARSSLHPADGRTPSARSGSHARIACDGPDAGRRPVEPDGRHGLWLVIFFRLGPAFRSVRSEVTLHCTWPSEQVAWSGSVPFQALGDKRTMVRSQSWERMQETNEARANERCGVAWAFRSGPFVRHGTTAPTSLTHATRDPSVGSDSCRPRRSLFFSFVSYVATVVACVATLLVPRHFLPTDIPVRLRAFQSPLTQRARAFL